MNGKRWYVIASAPHWSSDRGWDRPYLTRAEAEIVLEATTRMYELMPTDFMPHMRIEELDLNNLYPDRNP